MRAGIRAGLSPRPELPNRDEALIRALLENWARAVREADMESVLAHHAEAIVMFDVPAPLQVRGIDDYRRQWELIFKEQGEGAFDLGDLEIAAGSDVAFAHAILTCGTNDPASRFRVRLTVGLRKVDGDWLVTHEHHSVPAE